MQSLDGSFVLSLNEVLNTRSWCQRFGNCCIYHYASFGILNSYKSKLWHAAKIHQLLVSKKPISKGNLYSFTNPDEPDINIPATWTLSSANMLTNIRHHFNHLFHDGRCFITLCFSRQRKQWIESDGTKFHLGRDIFCLKTYWLVDLQMNLL